MKDTVERQIQQLLEMDDIDAQTLSRELFWVGGLFNQLAPTEQERKAVAQTPLFRQALARLQELEKLEVAELEEARQRRKAARARPTGGVTDGDGLPLPPNTPTTAPSNSNE
jgi:hypothetical protein